jgi:hypothetical protein
VLLQVAMIKRSVLEYLQQRKLRHFVEPGNEGVVVVHVMPSHQISG